jgi:predicted RNA-binding protein with PUA-like domain
VKLEREFKHLLPLNAIKANPALIDMRLVQRGNRLSILPVTAKEWNTILKMEKPD